MWSGCARRLETLGSKEAPNLDARETVLLRVCRYLALVYASGLAIGEAMINSRQDHWQYAPLWIIDFVIVAYLIAGFWMSRRGRYVPILMSAYALSTGVVVQRGIETPGVSDSLMSLSRAASITCSPGAPAHL